MLFPFKLAYEVASLLLQLHYHIRLLLVRPLRMLLSRLERMLELVDASGGLIGGSVMQLLICLQLGLQLADVALQLLNLAN